MPLLAKLLAALTRHRIRGETRLRVLLVDRLKLLRYVPIKIADWPPVFMDVRLPNTFELFVHSPLPGWDREPDEQLAMRRVVKAGDVTYDIGANIGLHTALLSRLVGPRGLVVAFEPNPSILPPLTKTVQSMPNAMLLPVALSDDAGESTLYLAEQLSEVASLANWTNGAYGEVTETVCHVRRLDDLIKSRVIPPPNFIKCDVEGAELRVFRGAVDTLDRVDAPIVFFEANVYTSRGSGFGMLDAMDFLCTLQRPGYVFFEVRSRGELAMDGPFNDIHSNILAVPKARLAEVAER
jgi:FkbM family methyltransferase